MTRRSVFAAAALFCAAACPGVEWNGLSEENWYSGRKLDAESLRGKVVMVDEWGAMCGPCISMLPRMAEIWNSFQLMIRCAFILSCREHAEAVLWQQ